MQVVVPPTSAAMLAVCCVSFAIGRHEGQVDVHVRVDESGEDVLAGGIDHFSAGRRFEVRADARDGFVFDEDVCPDSGSPR